MDTDTQNRKSNMVKAEGDRDDEAPDQQETIERPDRSARNTPEPEKTRRKTKDDPTLRTEM